MFGRSGLITRPAHDQFGVFPSQSRGVGGPRQGGTRRTFQAPHAADCPQLDCSVAPSGALRARATVIQQKTGRPAPSEITEPTREALSSWLQHRGRRQDDWLFPSRSRPGGHISTRQYARLVDRWVAMIDLEPLTYGTHSLRRTKVALVYKKTGNLRACQLLLGHRKLESTVRYLGIEVDDALELSEQIEL